jgi:hypothetical protein
MEARMLEICAGWDDREIVGFNLCQFSAIRRTSQPIRFAPLMEKALRYQDLYKRPEEFRNGQRWCKISDAPMSTAFANSRFLAPWLVNGGNWVLFCDFSDMLFLADPAELFELADEQYAIQVVKHKHIPIETVKMDNQQQTIYERKNWSSVILWNCRHPGTVRLTLDMVNTLPGRDLHRFCWLEDHEIGELPPEWNWLVGHDPDEGSPALLHYTSGTPELGINHPVWAEHWLRERSIMESVRPTAGQRGA